MKTFLIECCEVNYFTIEVDAESEDSARELAHADINSFDVIDEYVSEWDINSIKLVHDYYDSQDS
tara:strand:+ start:87 stop:281 length:195 start_codon:yes stop_codon:yes gene_type:complete